MSRRSVARPSGCRADALSGPSVSTAHGSHRPTRAAAPPRRRERHALERERAVAAHEARHRQRDAVDPVQAVEHRAHGQHRVLVGEHASTMRAPGEPDREFVAPFPRITA
jgi:hypothetical protein